ncbi:hypothetical protein [Aeromicrobium sp.]|uniref:hypothetical protein n=1 Tax=Aeromicrobium sp. TaxID=1871063 RepID=UPI003D6A5493
MAGRQAGRSGRSPFARPTSRCRRSTVQRDTVRPVDARASWQESLALLDEVGAMDSTDLSRAELVDLIEGGSG